MEDHLPNFAKEVNRLLVMLTHNTYQGNGTKAGLTVDSFIIAYAERFVNMQTVRSKISTIFLLDIDNMSKNMLYYRCEK